LFLEYYGPVDFEVINSLLGKLKKSREYSDLNLTTKKRIYALFVECLENIAKHFEPKSSKDTQLYPYIAVRREFDEIFVKSGNPVPIAEKDNLAGRLDHINKSDESSLKALYENKISSSLKDEEKCAGLGFISMALMSGKKIKYKLDRVNDEYLNFEIEISLKKYIMRKLVIDKKSNSPKVIFDPEKEIYLISGESRPPDVRGFYGPVLEWLEEFGAHLLKSDYEIAPLIFNFNFEYFNSSSAKLILDICKQLAELKSRGINIIVKWHSEKEDIDMLEAGKEFSRIIKFPFEYIEM